MLNLSQTNKTNLPLLYDEVLEKGYKKSFQEFINELLEEVIKNEIGVENNKISIKRTALSSLDEYIGKLEQFKKQTNLYISEDEQFCALKESLKVLGYECKDWGEFYDFIDSLKVVIKTSNI